VEPTRAEIDRLWKLAKYRPPSEPDVWYWQEQRFLDLLKEEGYGDGRLAGQVNLLVEILRRAVDLGWDSWPQLISHTDHTAFETYRKLRLQVRDMHRRKKNAIADGLGWARESIDLALQMHPPVVLGNPHSTESGGGRRGVFSRLGLPADALSDVLLRFDADDPATLQMADAIARALAIDELTVRELLLDSARNHILSVRDAERRGNAALAASVKRVAGASTS
jgi:hypothetical protein